MWRDLRFGKRRIENDSLQRTFLFFFFCVCFVSKARGCRLECRNDALTNEKVLGRGVASLSLSLFCFEKEECEECLAISITQELEPSAFVVVTRVRPPARTCPASPSQGVFSV